MCANHFGGGSLPTISNHRFFKVDLQNPVLEGSDMSLDLNLVPPGERSSRSLFYSAKSSSPCRSSWPAR